MVKVVKGVEAKEVKVAAKVAKEEVTLRTLPKDKPLILLLLSLTTFRVGGSFLLVKKIISGNLSVTLSTTTKVVQIKIATEVAIVAMYGSRMVIFAKADILDPAMTLHSMVSL